jgi:hypothetical protein
MIARRNSLRTAKGANWWTKCHEQKVRASIAGELGMILEGITVIYATMHPKTQRPESTKFASD